MKNLNESFVARMMYLPLLIGLLFTSIINGWNFLGGGKMAHIAFLSIFLNTPFDSYPAYFTIVFYVVGVLQLVAALLILYTICTSGFWKNKYTNVLKWSLLILLFSISIYGFMVRDMSNHPGAATLYFLIGLLYFLLWFTENESPIPNGKLFNYIKIIPIYFAIFYTMGLPGWQKLIHTSEVMDKYVTMFQSSFLADLPGGIPVFIYLLGLFEFIVPILLVVSLSKREIVFNKPPLFLNIALFVTILTFIMLSFGLSVLVNYRGSINLVFYAVFTFGFYLYIASKSGWDNKKEVEDI